MATLLFSYIVLALCSLSATVSADSVHVSIDCGSSYLSSYHPQDENFITWTADYLYTKGGASRFVKPADSISYGNVMDTLRVFTNTHKKNCYRVDSVRKGRVLVRASFYYGNYDNMSSPPTFDLHFDGNFWKTVVTSISEVVSHEVIYVMKKDWISVCVARTKDDQFPFISALEIRSLETFMYANINESYPLFLSRRDPFDSRTIRYPYDPYDRIWSTELANLGQYRFYSDADFDDYLRQREDMPPPAVLKYGITAPTTPNSSLEIFTLHNYETPAYVNVYFSEFRYNLRLNETRAFSVFEDDKQISVPISPLYANFTEICFSNLSVSGRSAFSLVPTTYSTLPPLISALEIFLIGDALTDGTDSRDVLGLGYLQKAFDVLQDWNGDPCLPAPYAWEWVVCNRDPRPRVTALYLGSFGLSGVLPYFESMDALQTIDLHNNSLKGNIPEFLGWLPDLKLLNLELNQLNGSVSISLLNKKGLVLKVGSNPDLCITLGKSCPSSCSRKKINSIVIQILFGSIILSIVLHAWS